MPDWAFHCIGAHIALANLRALQDVGQSHQLQQVVALFPFLAFDDSSWKQAVLRQVAAWPQTVGVFAAAVGCLPSAVTRAVMRFFTAGMDEHAVSATMPFLSYHHANNAMTLAGHEFRDLRAPLDWQWLQSLGSKLAVICAPNDNWFPEAQWRELQAKLPALQANLDIRMSHGFCASCVQSKALAPSVAVLCGFAQALEE